MNTSNQIQALHAAYVSATGLDIRLDISREREWFEYVNKGFTQEDLRLVIEHLKRGIREQRRNPGALKFRNLIGQLDYFEEDLAEARALTRAKKAGQTIEPGKAAVLRASGRESASQASPERRVQEIIESKGFQELAKFKETLK